MYSKILRLLCVLLLMLLAFVVGLSLDICKSPTIIESASQSVLDFMHRPKAADIRSVRFYQSGARMSNKVTGHVCGEVFMFKNELPYQYKRFIVEVTSDDNGKNIFSTPLLDFEGQMMPEPDFQMVWDDRCN
ncbi:hypothetical protein [Providencia stuartii]|uniref:hypothetical protein n=1 Tax=Providencia stuartii TaxID=588 RepID=UPI00300C6186